MNQARQHEVGATLRVVELIDMLRRAETPLLHALGVGRGVDPGLSATVAIELSDGEMHELLAACEEVIDRTDQLKLLVREVRPTGAEIRLRTLQIEAEAALSGGVADIERVELLARCLPVRAGFQALAAMLRCTDCHESWSRATVADVLGFFRDSEPRNVREVTELATVSPELRWEVCDRDQLGRLAAALERYAGAFPRSASELW